jgi:hypothetical protein
VARFLLVGGGCRALVLARDLVAEGHAVRATTREETRRAEIEAAGAECRIATPDRIGTLRYALEGVTVLAWLLGTVRGTPEQLEALHGSRLQFMLSQTIDTTVRGVVYEAAGTVPAELLAAGAERVLAHCAYNAIPAGVLTHDTADPAAWARATRASLDELLSRAASAPQVLKAENGG